VKIGYARVSTRDQVPQLQLDALNAAGVDDIRTEHASGKDRKRPVLEATLNELGEGDELVVWKIDRLGRSVLDLLTIVEDLSKRGIAFYSITNPEISTTGPGGKMVLTILGAIAEYERALIAERVTNGVAAARRNGTRSGKAIGRPRKLTDDDLDLLVELWDNGAPVAALAKKFKDRKTGKPLDQATIYRAYKRAKARQATT
jgi:DNA invertase Pin-like site-specific DNA recombinase